MYYQTLKNILATDMKITLDTALTACYTSCQVGLRKDLSFTSAINKSSFSPPNLRIGV